MDGERLLVGAARRGDARVYAALVRAHQRSLYCTAYSILGSSWDANDAVQDALLQAWARIETLREDARLPARQRRHGVLRADDRCGPRRERAVPDLVRLSDTKVFSDSQYQENFAVEKAGDRYLVEYMETDA